MTAAAPVPAAAPQATADQNAYVPLQQVEELLRQRQVEMAKKMDDYYQQRMKEVYSEAKAKTMEDAQKLVQAQREAIQVARTVKSRHDSDLQTHAQERARWESEKARLHEEAEKGYQELYTSIHTSHREAIVKLETELQRVKEQGQQERDM